MKKLRVLVLMHPDLIPPASLHGHADSEIVKWKTEYDVVNALREMGHAVHPLGVQYDLGDIRAAIAEINPDITFNLLEEFHGNTLFDYHVVSYLELMKQRYTGCNPRGLLLAHDKALAKQIFTFHRIATPRFAVFPMHRRIRIPAGLHFPLIIKSLFEEGSYGLAQASVVDTAERAYERIEYLHEQLGTPALAEEYIAGREFYVGVLGNQRVHVLPVLELEFGSIDEPAARIATARLKWDWKYQERHGIDIVRPRGVSAELLQRISKLARRIYRVLSLSGYARMDLRMREDGRMFVLEANANPDIGYGEEMATAAQAVGIDYQSLLQKVINLGLRYEPESRATA
jgi:D-alanine-D-alanine ligase